MASKPESGILAGFSLLKQRQTNWCWASVGVALAKYFKRPQTTQCVLANRVVNTAGLDCCKTPGDTACNSIQLMSAVLAEIGVARLAKPEQPQDVESFDFDLVRTDIARKRPIVCLLTGAEGDHYVVVVGWSMLDGIPTLHVDDPATGLRAKTAFLDFFNFRSRRLLQFTRLA